MSELFIGFMICYDYKKENYWITDNNSNNKKTPKNCVVVVEIQKYSIDLIP